MVRASRGFTLLEVLVALTVVAIAMGALIRIGGDQAANASYLQERTLAHWVGMNVVADYQLQESWPGTGRFQGEEEMMRQEWHWRAEISETFDNDVRRVDVSVRREPGTVAPVLATVVAFLPRPPQAPQGQLP